MIDNIDILESKVNDLKKIIFLEKRGEKKDKLIEQLNEYKLEVDIVDNNIELLEKVVILFQKNFRICSRAS